MQQDKEDLYNILKESGELFIFFEDMSGEWIKDKVKFCDTYDEVMSSLKEDNINDDK